MCQKSSSGRTLKLAVIVSMSIGIILLVSLIPVIAAPRALSASASPTLNISDIFGLQQALDIRPVTGTAFVVNRSAVINAGGSIDGATGNLSDCLRVDGSSGPCATVGQGVGSPVNGEIPMGVLDGNNAVFALSNAPSPPNTLHLYRNGLRLTPSLDYSLNGSVVTFIGAQIPVSGDALLADYTM
jgi:hypothetical protein